MRPRFPLLFLVSLSSVQGNALQPAHDDPKASTSPRVPLDPQPIEQWVARYNGPGDGFDFPTGLAVDHSGNVYVTGYSQGSDGNYDYATIKYSADGVEQWIAVNDGKASGLDVDDSGNVFVTGTSSSDFVTIKYDANGMEEWQARYDVGEEEAIDIAIDDSGNVFVTGSSVDIHGLSAYVTIKYNSAGIRQWASRLSGWPRELAADGIGGVCVTGYFYSEFTSVQGEGLDMITFKFDATGSVEWAAFYGGLGSELGIGVAVDSLGNVYLAGQDEGVNFDEDYAIFKYDRLGIQQWVQYYDGTDNDDDEVTDIVIDVSGNVYVTGWSYSSDFGDDFATIKYDASGVRQWVARFNGPGNAFDIPEGNPLAVDGAGNVYVTGESYGSGTSYDFATVKYDASGVQKWVVLYNGPGNGEDLPYDISVDSDAVYVTGYSTGLATSYDYVTIKYVFLPATVTLVSPINGAIITSDSVQLVWNESSPVVDRYWLEGDTDSLFSTPFIDSLLTDTTDTVTPLHNNSTFWWRVRAHNSHGWGPFGEIRSFFVYQEIPGAPLLLAPPNGAVGVSISPTLTWNVSVGSETYALQMSDTPDFSNLVVNQEGIDSTSYFVGELENNTTYYWRVSAMNDLGTSEWSETWSFRTLLSQPAQVILSFPEDGSTAVSSNDSVACLWNQIGPEVDRYWLEWSFDTLFTVAEIDSALTDTTGFVGPLENGQTYWWRARAHNGAGWGPFSEVWNFSVLITGIEEENEIPKEFSLSQNYPDPFNPSTTIRYALSGDAHVSLKIYNMLGQLVATRVDELQAAGYRSVTWNGRSDSGAGVASGMYIYRLMAGNFTAMKRMLLLK